MAAEQLHLAELTRATKFDLAPDGHARRRIADRLGISALKKLRFSGTLSPESSDDWRLEAKLGATVTQPCVVTLAPVITRIEEDVTRRYLADMPPLPEGDEIEMPADETIEPLPLAVDLLQVMEEALALALPAWPRAEGVDPIDLDVAAPGAEPLSDDVTKPFSSLKSLMDRPGGDGSESD